MKLRVLLPALAVIVTAHSAHAYGGTSGPHCREFTKIIHVGGRAQTGYGTSCLQPDGSWLIVQAPQFQSAHYVPATYVTQVHSYHRPVVRPFVLGLHLGNRHHWHHRHKPHYRHHYHKPRWHHSAHRQHQRQLYSRPNRGDRFNNFR